MTFFARYRLRRDLIFALFLPVWIGWAYVAHLEVFPSRQAFNLSALRATAAGLLPFFEAPPTDSLETAGNAQDRLLSSPRDAGDSTTQTSAEAERSSAGDSSTNGRWTIVLLMSLTALLLSQVLWFMRRDAAARYLSLGAVCLAFLILSMNAADMLTGNRALAFQAIALLLYPQLLALAIHFSYLFPVPQHSQKQLGFRRSINIYLGLTVSVVLFTLHLLSVLKPEPHLLAASQTAMELFQVLAAIASVYILINIFNNERRQRSPATQQKIHWLLIGLSAMMLAAGTLYMLPLELGHTPVIPRWLLPGLSLIMLTALTIALVNVRRAVQIQTISFRLIQSIIITSGLLGSYVIIAGGISRTLGDHFWPPNAVAGLLAGLVTALIYKWTQHHINHQIIRALFPLKAVYHQSLGDFRESSERHVSHIQLVEHLQKVVQMVIPVDEQAVYLRHDDLWISSSATEKDIDALRLWLDISPPASLTVNHPFLLRLERAVDIETALFTPPWVLACPIGSHAFWFLSAKTSRQVFYREDLHLLEELMRISASAWERINALQEAALQKTVAVTSHSANAAS